MTDCESILDMQKKCWDYLIDIQKTNSSFYFVPRKINKLGRLKQGYFFIGNDKYMQISFWDGDDRLEKIHNISWGVRDNGSCFIEISSRDNTDKAEYLAELVKILEQKRAVIYQEVKLNKWRYEYPSNLFYMDTLQSFIDIEKPIIDEFISKHPGYGISMLDKEFNEKYVSGLIQTLTQGNANKKKEGVVSVSPSGYFMALQHNELQNALVDYLETNGDNSVKIEVNNVDITVQTVTGENIFYELKTSDVKQAIRLAMGQLLEYCHYPNKTKADRLVIVTRYAPSDDDIIYLDKIRNLYHVPIYYQQFDMEKKQLLSF
ncbi:hypothetical protein SPSYN_02104 [Sporotomaculum syntrophicum]|uniref:Uncharacterized protein n=1 Tax=Sporotomaculum syntrophicum TaxID=182264 RepID=A0A9D3AY27_9FIRM|nr:hypothetical protein [Sporotomaculum syntrophicum]KAF1084328.1 hypothetical protein SPSYN_02104 [Sporotomaculum syntrophicum]